MDQKKIGNFISKKRKERNLTQKDLAEKLNISVNAVSKWERGICLMDMSLLKPLSTILEITITELINGEEDNKNSEIAVEKAINYTNKRIKKIKKKSLILILSGILLSFLFGYKLFLVGLVNNLNDSIYKLHQSDNSKKVLGDPVFIQTKKASTYFQFKDIKMENIFDKALINEETIDSVSYLLGKNKLINLSTDNSVADGLEVFKNMNSIVNNKKYLQKFEIENDLDVYQFLADYINESVNIFNSLFRINEVYFRNNLYYTLYHSFDEVHELKGNLTGYVVVLNDKYISYTFNKNDLNYNISFIGDFDFNYTVDFISTIV